jgi:hypothetical protein
MDLALDDAETELVREVLDHTYRELSYEIADTDSSAFKAQLKDRRSALRSILDRVGGPLPDR